MEVPLGRIAEVRMGYSFRSRLEVDMAGDVAVIQMKDIDEDNLLQADGLTRIDMPELKARHLVQQGDLLFRSRGMSNSAAVVGAGLERAVLAAPMLLIRPHPGAVEPAYLQWFVNLPATQATLSAQATGTAVKMVGIAALEQLAVAVPPPREQQRIVEISRLAAREIRLLKDLIQQRKTLVDGVLLRQAQKSR